MKNLADLVAKERSGAVEGLPAAKIAQKGSAQAEKRADGSALAAMSLSERHEVSCGLLQGSG